MGAQGTTHAYRLGHWVEMISQCRNSGQTVTAWCENQSINIKSYYYWQRQVREAASKALPACQQSGEETATGIQPVFTELTLPKANSYTGAAVIIRFHEAVVEIQNGADPAVIANAVQALKSL